MVRLPQDSHAERCATRVLSRTRHGRHGCYVENKNGDIDGATARIGWVTLSKTGLTVYYRGKALGRAKGGGVVGNHFDTETGDEYWVTGVKKAGSNTHWAETAQVVVDDDAINEYRRIRSGV